MVVGAHPVRDSPVLLMPHSRVARRVGSYRNHVQGRALGATAPRNDHPRRNTTIGEVRAMRSVPIQPASATSSAAPAISATSGRIGGA